jgi:hypothetical protein
MFQVLASWSPKPTVKGSIPFARANLLKRVMLMNEKKKQQEKSPKKETLSRKDLEELMGTKRDTYKRVHGSVRRK